MPAQITVEVPRLLGATVEVPQVQLLGKFDTPVVYSQFEVFEFCIPVEVDMVSGDPRFFLFTVTGISVFYPLRRFATGIRILQVRLLGHPELRKRP